MIMPLSGRICLLLFAMVLTLGFVLDNPRSFAVRPANQLTSSMAGTMQVLPSPER
jgi:hypothetical protein